MEETLPCRGGADVCRDVDVVEPKPFLLLVFSNGIFVLSEMRVVLGVNVCTCMYILAAYGSTRLQLFSYYFINGTSWLVFFCVYMCLSGTFFCNWHLVF